MENKKRNPLGELEKEAHHKAIEFLEKVKQQEAKLNLITVRIDKRTIKYMTKDRYEQYKASIKKKSHE